MFGSHSPAGTSRPDFIFTQGQPKNGNDGEPSSLLVGDIKLSVLTIVRGYFGWSGQGPNQRAMRQWDAITGYAKKHGARITGFVTLYSGSQQDQSALRQKLQQESFSKGVVTLLASAR